jgi:hypothetical protein
MTDFKIGTFNFTVTEDPPPVIPPPVIYGNPTSGDSLSNVEIGRNVGRKVSFRFRADRTDALAAIRLFFKSGSGYSAGTGGSILVELQTNTPGADTPSGTVLASHLITDPNPAASQIGRVVTFDAPAGLLQGNLYHLVFTNQDAAPDLNYVSLNTLTSTTSISPRNVYCSDQDLAVVVFDSNLAGRRWTVNGRMTPILELDYMGGGRVGNGQVNIASSSELKSLGGSNEVREVFTPSAPVSVSNIHLWLYTPAANPTAVPPVVANTQDLEVYVEDNAGVVLAVARIAASQVPAMVGWVAATLSAELGLAAGVTYVLHLRSYNGSNTAFKIFPTQDGSSNGFNADKQFTDGHAQFSTDRGLTWAEWVAGHTDRDLMFYFS